MYSPKSHLTAVCFVLLSLVAVSAVAQAQPDVNPAENAAACDDESFRQSVADLAAQGASDDEIAALIKESCNVVSLPGFLGAEEKGLTVTNNGSVFFEALNACGYHPQAEVASCDVQVRQNFGYGGAAGTPENVLFCFDCDQNGLYEFQTLGFVNVTDNFSGQAPPWQFEAHATTFQAPAGCTVNNGGVTNARAILTWLIPATALPGFANCTVPPGVFFWGNTVDFMARRDP